MEQYFGFLNSSYTNNKIRKYDDMDFARMLSLFTNGQGYVSGYMDELAVVPNSEEVNDMKVRVKTGAAWLGEPAGWWFINEAETVLEFDNADLSQEETRVDRVVIKLNRNTDELSIKLEIKKGPFSGEFLDKLSSTEGRTHEISLANVVVTGGSSILIITDERNSEYCGVVRIGGASVGSSSASMVLENPAPIKSGDNVAGNLLSWIEETSMWEKREFGQPYDGTNIILPGGRYVKPGAFAGEEGYRLYRQADGMFSSSVRSAEYYIGYALDADTALIGVLGGIDKNYSAVMQQFNAIPSASTTIDIQVKMPEDATGVKIYRSTSVAYAGEGVGNWGTLVVDITDDSSFHGANNYYIDTGLANGQKYYYHAFPYVTSTETLYNEELISDNASTCYCRNGQSFFTFDNVSGNTVYDEYGNYNGIATNIVYTKATVGNGSGYVAGDSRIQLDLGISRYTLVTDFTWSLRVTVPTGTDPSYIYCIDRGSGYKIGYNIAVIPDGRVRLQYTTDSSTWSYAYLNVGLIAGETYSLVLYLKTSATREFSCRVNGGSEIATTFGALYTNDTYGAYGNHIGTSYVTGGTYSFPFVFDQYRVFNGKLSQEDAISLHNSGLAVF